MAGFSLKVLISVCIFLNTGCAYIEYTGQWPPTETKPPNEQIYIVPDKPSFKSGDKITGIFKNNTFETLYVLYPDGGGDSPLQKWNGENWKRINTKPSGVGFIQVVSYGTLKRGETRRLTFPEKRLREKGLEVKGVYRFLFTISPEKGAGNWTTVHSRKFIVE